MNKMPKTFLTGYTTANEEGIIEYLKYTGQEDFLQDWKEALDSGISSGEALCSFYAKLCYKSLVEGKNLNITRTRSIENNIKGTMDSGHGCYDELTDVLTKRGWVNWTEVTDNDEFLTVSNSNQLIYQKANKLIRTFYTGEMFGIDSSQVNLMVTPNHQMYVCKTSTKEGRKKNDFRLVRADTLHDTAHCYTKCFDAKIPSTISDEYTLLGFAIGDGHISSKKRVQFHLRKPRKIKWLKDLCSRLKWILTERDDYYTVIIPDEYVDIFNQIYDDNKEKVIPKSLLEENRQEVVFGLFNGLMESDGSKDQTSWIYCTTSMTLANQFQHLCVLVGLSCNFGKPYLSQFGQTMVQKLHVIRRSNKPHLNKNFDDCPKSFVVDDFKGEVFCAELPDNTKHLLYVRRNGIPVWCGNSVFEHCGINFVTTDCSRVYSHELVRHRVGTAFSQTSGRYVAIDDIDLVLSPELLSDENVLNEIENLKNNIVGTAKKLRKLLIEDKGITDFATKKKITSAIRRIAPNGQTNEIGWTVNIRSLRHTILMRTSRHAEYEIRYVFNEAANIIENKFPLMLYGIKKEMVDGLYEYTGLKI